MARVRVNVIANFMGSAANAVLAIVLVPFYLRYLGIEAFGLVGFFATLQAVFGLLDLGLGLTLNRGLARLSAVEGSQEQQRNLVRTLETIYWLISIGIALIVYVGAELIATRWLHGQNLSQESIVSAIRLMGMVIALQFPFALYKAGLMGLQRQVAVNILVTASAAIRGFGAIAVLAFIAPTIAAFFSWHIVVAVLQTAITLAWIWKAISPAEAKPARFRLDLLRSEWKFAAAVSANAIIGSFLTQSDKIVLSGILPLDTFGYYALAATVAGSLWFVISPVNTAVYPRFTQFLELGRTSELENLYHDASQVVAATLLPVAAVLIFFPREAVWVWTGSPVAAENTWLIIALLAAGTAVNGLVSVPMYLASAAGWPQLMMLSNGAAALVLVPAMIPMAMRFGAPGAASVWLVLNVSYLLITVPLMHRRLIPDQKWRWYIRDVALPMIGSLSVVALFWYLSPPLETRVTGFLYIAMAGFCSAVATTLAAGRLRRILFETLRKAVRNRDDLANRRMMEKR